MAVADIHGIILAEASNGVFGTKNKLADFVTSEFVLPSEDPIEGLSEHGRVNVCDGYR